MAYFVGNVLSPTDTQPEQHDATFAFTRQEAAALDLKDVPIRMEHDDKLEVGRIVTAWDGEDGSKWVMGRVDDSTMRGRFATHAIRESSNGLRYYTGLSLQHTHTQYASGATRKDPVEVSLCVDPRRDDCRITFVHASKNTHYKGRAETVKMTDETTAPVQTTPEIEPVVEEPKSSEPPVEFQQAFMGLAAEKDALEAKLAEQEKMVAQFQAEKKKQAEQEQARAEALVKTVVAEWGKQMGDEDMKSAESSMMKVAAAFPQESQEFLRIAHHASKKHAEQRTLMEQTAEKGKDAALKDTFNKVMTKQVHAASAKKKEEKQHFMEVLNKYRNPGKGRDRMEQVVELNKRRRMY